MTEKEYYEKFIKLMSNIEKVLNYIELYLLFWLLLL